MKCNKRQIRMINWWSFLILKESLLENSAVWMTESILVFLKRFFLVEFHANFTLFVQTKEIFNEILW